MKRISNRWKNLIWFMSGVVAISTIVGVTFGMVKKDKYLQAYDLDKQIFDENKINEFVKIVEKDNISEISANDFASQFQKEHSLNSDILKKYTNVTLSDNLSDYIIRMFNFIINKSDNTLNFIVELRHKTTQNVIVFQKIISGFKKAAIEKITNDQTTKIKTNFKVNKNKDINVDEWITNINNSTNPIEKTNLFSNLITTTINKEYVLYIVDDIKKENNTITFKYKFWKLQYDRAISVYTQTFSDIVTSTIEI
ncbi:hypothetical protein KQ875_00660 [Mycoplasma zalophi]|uniref:Lipoprotein n=1 Tax=Mycoplasma zalophi TaxID=191287 RepID=A0ABS6DP59_9MOLU|nr:hypothetical protein [Mycoplasma zalophi]MBU4692109.1 hypothetical protein [Mycoplasma zalophi]